MAQSRERLFTADLWDRLAGYSAYDDVPVPDRIKRWNSLNQSLYAAYKVMLPGMLLSAKGDRATRHSATEGRYPFLDERVVDFCAASRRIQAARLTDKWLFAVSRPRCCLAPSPTGPKPCSVPTWARRSSARIGLAGWINCSVRNRCGRPAISTPTACVSPKKAQLQQAAQVVVSLLAGHGIDRRHLDAVVASYLLRRRLV